MTPEHPVPQDEHVGAEDACPKDPRGPELGQAGREALSALPFLLCLDVPICNTRTSKGQPVLTLSLGFLHSLA